MEGLEGEQVTGKENGRNSYHKWDSVCEDKSEQQFTNLLFCTKTEDER